MKTENKVKVVTQIITSAFNGLVCYCYYNDKQAKVMEINFRKELFKLELEDSQVIWAHFEDSNLKFEIPE